MAPNVDKAFWVKWKGAVARRDGSPVDPSDDTLTAYLSFLTAKLSGHDDLEHPAVAAANAHLWLASSVSASSKGVAIDKVKQAFDECLAKLGNDSLPGGEHPSWSVYTLEGEATVVRELLPTS